MTWLIALNVVLIALVILLAFLTIGALRVLGVLSWRLEQIEVTSPRRIGRDGIPVGRTAPDFALPTAKGDVHSLHDFAARKVLLVFTQSGCGPCHDIMPELTRVHRKAELQVIVVNNGKDADLDVAFPVLIQEQFTLSKRYEVFATPFAFVIDAAGVVVSKGLIGTRQHLGFVLNGAGSHAIGRERESAEPLSTKEVSHA